MTFFFDARNQIMEGEHVMIYGYARVSTKTQAKDGNSLEAQGKGKP